MTFEDMKDLMNLAYINTERQAVDIIPILSHFIFDGVFERHPRLRLGLTETGVGWIPFFLEQSDDNFLRHRFWTNNHLRMLPSEYFHRNCFATFQIDRYGVRNRDLVGIQSMMWSSDYPHSGADWPNSRSSIESQLAGVPAQERQAILCDNALRLLGLSRDEVGRDAPSLVAAGR